MYRNSEVRARTSSGARTEVQARCSWNYPSRTEMKYRRILSADGARRPNLARIRGIEVVTQWHINAVRADIIRFDDVIPELLLDTEAPVIDIALFHIRRPRGQSRRANVYVLTQHIIGKSAVQKKNGSYLVCWKVEALEERWIGNEAARGADKGIVRIEHAGTRAKYCSWRQLICQSQSRGKVVPIGPHRRAAVDVRRQRAHYRRRHTCGRHAGRIHQLTKGRQEIGELVVPLHRLGP